MEVAETVGVCIQGDEDSTPEPQAEELPVDAVSTTITVLLCVSGCLNGFPVIVLIDSGASECFVGIVFAEKNGLEMTKTKEKLEIHLVDGTVRVSNRIVK